MRRKRKNRGGVDLNWKKGFGSLCVGDQSTAAEAPSRYYFSLLFMVRERSVIISVESHVTANTAYPFYLVSHILREPLLRFLFS